MNQIEWTATDDYRLAIDGKALWLERKWHKLELQEGDFYKFTDEFEWRIVPTAKGVAT